MLGMLDYRAHKLLWLITLPWVVVVLLASWGASIVVPLIIQSQLPHYHFLVKVLIAWVGVELGGGLILALVNWVVASLIKRVFFWIIDVLPAHGKDAEEAKAVVLVGPMVALAKKHDNDIENWNDEDTNSYIACMNWRARWFFPVRDRLNHNVEEFKKIYRLEELQPCQVDQRVINSIKQRFPGKKENWFEVAIILPHTFYMALRLIVVVLVLAYVK